MSLVRVRERLHAIDMALSEIQKAITRAGKELLTADSLLGSVMGEAGKGDSRGPTWRRTRKAKESVQVAASDGRTTEASESVAISSQPRGKRGRPKKVATETTETTTTEEEESSSA